MPRRFRTPFALLVLSTALLVLWLGRWAGQHSRDTSRTPHGTQSPAAFTTRTLPHPSSAASSASATAQAPPAPALLALTERSRSGLDPQEDRWATAKTLAEAEGPAPHDAELLNRVRIVHASFKYPAIRIEETLRRDNRTGTLTLLAQEAMVADHALVKLAPGVTDRALIPHLAALGASIRESKPASGLYLVTIPSPLDPNGLPTALGKLGALSGIVTLAEPDFIVHANIAPDDPSFPALYGLHNTGQTGGVSDADIDAPEAWNISVGSRAVRIGVIDTGIDFAHPDLSDNIWTNPDEIPGNNIDDDGNGYVDDVRGWDFVNNDNDPRDDHYHGTHCAGTIGAAGGNALGVVGVNWRVSLVGLKFLSAGGFGATSDAVEAVSYANNLGLDLTSNSWGGGGYSQALYEAIATANTAGRLFVAAAGNSARNTDASPNYPSAYNLPNIISVAATDHADQLAYFSNYGVTSVDLAAPGVNILSTAPGGSYRTLSGTSMAAPHVAGAAALLLARQPGLSASEIKAALLASADPIPALADKLASGGRLNLAALLATVNRLLVASAGNWSAIGPVGGPFPAAATTYTLSNRSEAPRGWTFETNVPWAVPDISAGTLLPGANAVITVTLDSAAAAALTSGTHTGQVVIRDTSDGSTQISQLVLIATPPAILTFNLDNDPGWPRSGQWEFGKPTGSGGATYGKPDPAAGFSGANVFGVNLAGDYTSTGGAIRSLVAGPFDLSGYVATRLQFRRWLNQDLEPYASASVEISTNGATWQSLWRNGGALITESAWSLQDIDLSAYADGQATVYLRWSYSATPSAWSMSGWNIDDIAILGEPPRIIRLEGPASVAETAGSISLTLRMEPPSDQPLTVSIASSRSASIAAPAPIVVPAGAESVPIPLSILDNALLDGARSVVLTPSASGHVSRPWQVTVQDNESATLSFTLPAGAVEGGQAVVTLNVTPSPTQAFTAKIFTNSSDAASAPATVIIPAGAASVPFTIQFPDNIRLEGTRLVTLRADVADWTDAIGEFPVADDDTRTLALTIASGLAEGAGTVADAGTVTLGGTLSTPLTLAVNSTRLDQLAVPAQIVIPAGALSAKFSVTLPDDDALDGVQTVLVTASANTYADASQTVTVADNDPASFAFDPIPSPQYKGQPFAVRIRALDKDGASAAGFKGSASLSGSNGATSVALDPTTTSAFAAGVWTGTLTPQVAGDAWTVTAGAPSATGTSNSFQVLLPVVQALALATNDLVYDAATARIYATTAAGTVLPVNPTDGTVASAVTVAGTAATNIARASDGSRLWVLTNAGTSIRSVSLPGLVPGASFSMPANFVATDIVAPVGEPSAIACREFNANSYLARIRVYDSGIARNAAYSNYFKPVDLEAGLAGRLYGYNSYDSGFNLARISLDASGTALIDETSGLVSGYSTTIHADGSLIASSDGRVIDGETRRLLAALPYSGLVRPSASDRRIYALTSQGGGVYRLRAYDTDRFNQVGSMDIAGVSGTPANLIRWGATGLAFRTPTQLFLVNTTLVPAAAAANLQVTQLVTPNPAVLGRPLHYLVSVRNLGGGTADSVSLTDTFPAGTTLVTASASQGQIDLASTAGKVVARLGALPPYAEASLRITVTPVSGSATNTVVADAATGDPDGSDNQSISTVTVSAPASGQTPIRANIGARDLAYDPSSGRLLVTLGSAASALPNTLLRVDPSSVVPESADHVGYNPGRLKLSSNNQYAYAILDGSFGIARAPVVPGASPRMDFGTGHYSTYSNNSYSLTRPVDLTPVTGLPDSILVSRRDTVGSGIWPTALFVDGIRQSVTANTGITLVDGPTSQRAYHHDSNSLFGGNFGRAAILADGVAELDSAADLAGGTLRLKRAGALVYTESGRVIDPEALTLLANVGATGPVEPSIDDEAFYILSGSTLRSYDLVTRAAIGTLALGTIDGTPVNLVRCGGRSLAFVTSTGQLYLVDAPSSLVPDPPLRVTLPPRLKEGAGSAPGAGSISILRSSAQDIVVNLVSSEPAVLDPSRTVVIPAGQTSATFDLIVTDNNGLNGTRSVTVTPSTTSAFTGKAATTLVDDDETATLTLSLPASVTEATAATNATLTLSSPAAAAITVTLVSSDTTELTMPPSVVIPAGAASVSFSFAAPDDDLIDGTQSVTITATVPGYNAATTSIDVSDNESRNLRFVTGTTPVKEGDGWFYPSVALSGKTLAPIVITLSSSDTSEMTVPPTATITAGNSSASLTCPIVNDSLTDGAQTVTLSASAPGFTPANTTVVVRDDDPYTAEWSTIANQTAGTAFSASLTFKTIDGFTATAFNGNPAITATNQNGDTPLKNAPFILLVSSGAGTGSFTLTGAGPETRLNAQANGFPAFTSNPFTVQPGAFARFGISAIPSPQDDATPLSLALTAQDANGNRVTSFAGNARLTVGPPSRITGTGTLSHTVPFNGNQSRTQSIYLASEVGAAADLAALSIKGYGSPNGSITTFTIRIKPTTLSAYTSATWEATGWTTVYQGPVPALIDGWFRFPFAEPYRHDGTANLMVDISYDLTSSASYVSSSTITTATRTLYRGVTGQANPLTWTGSTPTPSTLSAVLNLRFEPLGAVTLSPSIAAPFVDGAWRGSVAFASPADAVVLTAASAAIVGESNLFSIAHAAPVMNPEPPVSGGTANTLAWAPRGASSATLAQAAPDSSFEGANLRSSPWLDLPSYSFTPLAEGAWFYRARSRAEVARDFTWTQTTQGDFATFAHTDSSADIQPGSITLARSQTIATESFDAPGTSWNDTLLTVSSGTAIRSALGAGEGPSTTPPLPVNQGGDLEAEFYGGQALRPADTAFTDGTIEAVITPRSPTGGLNHTILVLRAQKGTGDTIQAGYGAGLIFNANGTARADINYYYAGATYWLGLNYNTFTVSPQDNFRLRFSASGNQLSLRLWRIVADSASGSITETPITFGGTVTTLGTTQTRYPGAGVAGIVSYVTTSAQRSLLDDVAITSISSNYVTEGRCITPVFSPVRFSRWNKLYWSASQPEGTAVAVDVLDAAGALLAADVPSGGDLGAIPAVAPATALRFRIRLSTTKPAITPTLDELNVSYDYAEPTCHESAWSSVISSVQDATSPTVAITSAVSSATPAYTLAGTATDANGVAYVTVDGLHARSSNAHENWSRIADLSPGANEFTIIAADTAVPPNTRAVAASVIFAPPPPPLDSDGDGLPDYWELAHRLNPNSASQSEGRLGDPDRDGLPNLLEYGLGLDPTLADLGTNEKLAPDPESPPDFIFSYRRLIAPGSLTYRILASQNLSTWDVAFPAPELIEITPNTDGLTETVKLRLAPISPAGRNFFRVEINSP